MDEDEKVAEQEATKEVKEDEVRAAIIAEYGFDEVDDAERIDKLTKKEVEHKKKLNAAIGQKIKHRTDAEALKNDPRLKEAPPPPPTPKPAEDINKTIDERLAQRDLEEIQASDKVKKEISEWAKFKGISIKQAATAPHIVSQIADEKKAEEADEAAINRTNRSSGKKSYSADAPPKVDMSTEEGRKEYDDWKKWAIAQGH